jgi:hypothetical protein
MDKAERQLLIVLMKAKETRYLHNMKVAKLSAQELRIHIRDLMLLEINPKSVVSD